MNEHNRMSASGTRASYRPDIDGLRAVAVLAVIAFHFGMAPANGGFVGVDVFFVISGYVIVSTFAGRLDFSLGDFYERRIRRILPALALVVAVTYAVCFVLFLDDGFTEFSRHLRALGIMASNWSFAAVGYFDGPATSNPILHTWTLSVEAQFYLVAPLILMLCKQRTRLAAASFSVLSLVSFVYGVMLAQSGDLLQAFYNSFGRFWEIGIGAVAALLPVLRFPRGPWSVLARIVGLAAIATAVIALDPSFAFPGYWALLPTGGALLFVLASPADMDPTYRAAISAPLVYVGKISYSLYLWHWPIVVFSNILVPQPSFVSVALGIALSFLLSALTFRFVETPARKVPGRRPWRFGGAAAAFAVALVVLGQAGLMTGGFVWRLPEAVRLARSAITDRGHGLAVCGRENWAIFTTQVPQADTAPCVLGTPGAPPTFMLIGDSHADALIAVFDEIARSKGVAGLATAYNSCAPIVTLRNKSTNHPGCEWINATVIGSLSRLATIDTVILAGRWSSYDTTSMFDLAGQSGHELFASGIDATRASLPAGARVVVLGEVPTHSQRVPNALALDILLNRESSLWQETAAGHAKATSYVNGLFRDLAAKGWLVFVDPAEQLCSTGICTVAVDGRPIYSDTNHLSNAGARYLSDVFATALR